MPVDAEAFAIELRAVMSRLAGGKDVGVQHPKFFFNRESATRVAVIEGVVETHFTPKSPTGKFFLTRQPVLMVTVCSPKEAHPRLLAVIGMN